MSTKALVLFSRWDPSWPKHTGAYVAVTECKKQGVENLPHSFPELCWGRIIPCMVISHQIANTVAGSGFENMITTFRDLSAWQEQNQLKMVPQPSQPMQKVTSSKATQGPARLTGTHSPCPVPWIKVAKGASVLNQ